MTLTHPTLPSVDIRKTSPEFGTTTILRPFEADLVLVPAAGPDPLIERIDPARLTLLTERQEEVFSLVMSGMSRQEIRDKLDITESPLSSHLIRARKTLGIEESFAVENELTDREHGIAVSAARGMKYKEIADETGLTISSVRTHLHNIYGKLGISSKSELSGKFEFSEDFIDMIDFSRLSPIRRRTMELKSIGMPYRLIARALRKDKDLSASTARTHSYNIYEKLPGINNNTQLAQIGRGYIRKIGSAALEVQPAIVDKLAQLEQAEASGNISLANPERVKKIQNYQLMEYLRDKFYIS